LINLNLMLANQNGVFDQQNYLPLGLLYIAAVLEKEGHNVEFIDYQLFSGARSFNAAAFAEAVGETAKLVGISCMSNLLPFAIRCAEQIKKTNPGGRVVLGGVGPSPVAREIVTAFPFIDSVVEGEGELPMLDLALGKQQKLPPRKAVRDLEVLPLPAYSLVNFSAYDAAPSVITSRGCPYGCSFCTEPHNFGRSIRYRGVASVIEEIELLHGLSGHSLFLFQDDILPGDRQRFKALLKALRGLSFPIRWKCFSRVDLMDEEIMGDMAESGCVQVRYGIESGSNTTLKIINKGFTIEKAYRVAEKSLEYFPSVHASFIWGYPFEDMKGFKTTLRWVSKFEDAGVSVLLFDFSPLPGSSLYKEFQDDLTFREDSYSFFVVTGDEIIRPAGFQAGQFADPTYQLIRKYPKIFSGFYQYRNKAKLRKQEMVEEYTTSRRTGVRNIHDV